MSIPTNSSPRDSEGIALITGAGSGIGRHVALALVESGFNCVLAGRDGAKLEDTIQLSQDAAKCQAIPTDVREEDSVTRLFDEVRNRYGKLDLLFNNAGINLSPTPIDEVTVQAWEEISATNITGMFLCAREAFRLMKSQQPAGGRIINNGSISAQSPRPLSAPYTMTKHAITGLTKSLQLDGREHHIVASQIDIGNTATEMTEKMASGVLQADGSVHSEPVFDVQHVAKLIAFQAALPLDVNLASTTIIANQMPFAGRG